MGTKNDFASRVRRNLRKTIIKEQLCDCEHKKARLVFACKDCVPTSNFPKGVRRAREISRTMVRALLEQKKNSCNVMGN